MSTSVNMSRIGRKPITVPSNVEIKFADNDLAIKGPKGSYTLKIHPLVKLVIEGNVITVLQGEGEGHYRKGSGSKLKKAIVGTTRANIQNFILGVSVSFEKKLLLVGVGYKAQTKGDIVHLTLGYSTPREFPIPQGIDVETPTPTEIIIKGIDKTLVGLVASKIRQLRGPEPYKGKGIRYANEVIIRKETKKK
jgi:large subunit ribosomal protein L6